MFMPLGEAFSVDAVLKRRRRESSGRDAADSAGQPAGYNKMWLSFATIGFTVQIFIVYYFTAMIKTGAPWRDGTAVYIALSLDQFTTRIGYIFYKFPAVMKLLTHSVIWFELVGPWMLISPFFTQQLRTISVIGIWLMHIGFGMCMEIGLFPWLPIPCTMILLPPMFWDKLLAWVCRRRNLYKRGMAIYYNPKCGESFATLLDCLRSLLLTPDCKLKPCPSAACADPEDDNKAYHLPDVSSQMTDSNACLGVVLDSTGSLLLDHQAVFAMIATSWVLWPLSYLLKVGFVARLFIALVYKGLDYYRPTKSDYYEPNPKHTIDVFDDPLGSAGKLEVKRRLLFAAKNKKRRMKKALAIGREVFMLIVLIIVLDWNYSSFYRIPIHLPKITHKLVDAFRLDQWWGMFSPQPPTDDGWFVMPAQLANGQEIDLFQHGAPVTWEKPAMVSHMYYSEKWRKYMMNLYSENNYSQRLGYGRYLCRNWNWYGGREPSEKVVSFQIIYNREYTLPDYRTTPVEKVVVWDHKC